jgi:hypothetical protein
LLGSFRLFSRRRDLPKIAEEVVTLRDRDRESLVGALPLVTLAGEVVACFLRHPDSSLTVMADHPLAGVYLKLQRAHEHFTALYVALENFRDSQREAVSFELDPDTGDKVWTVSEVVGQPPPAISLIVGDTVHNARSALDHLAVSLVRWSGHEATTRNQFPVFTTDRKFQRHVTEYTQGMLPGMVRRVELTQPYKRTNRPKLHPLWLAHALDVIDKHRELHMGLASVHTRLIFPGEAVPASSLLEPGTELSRVPAEQMEVQFAPVVEVAFRDGPARAEPVAEVLRQILVEVGIVLERFRETFFRSAHGSLPNFDPLVPPWKG